MADPRPPTREDLAQFLPNQRAIRAFEKLFDLIPSALESLEGSISLENTASINEKLSTLGGMLRGILTQLNATQSTSVSTGSINTRGGLGVAKDITLGGILDSLDTTQSTSAATGAIHTLGGLGVAKDTILGGSLEILDETQSTSPTTGAIHTDGGLGVVKDVFLGGNLDIIGNIAIGDADIVATKAINCDVTPQDIPLGTIVPVIDLKVTIDNSVVALPTAILSVMTIVDGHTFSIPHSFRSEVNQNSSTVIGSGFGYLSLMNTGVGSTGGSFNPFFHFRASSPVMSGTGVFSAVIGMDIADQGNAATVTTATGLKVDKQTGSTNVAAIWINGDGVGADLVFGLGEDANIYYDATNLVINPKLAGTGYVDITGAVHAEDEVVSYGNIDIIKYIAMRS